MHIELKIMQLVTRINAKISSCLMNGSDSVDVVLTSFQKNSITMYPCLGSVYKKFFSRMLLAIFVHWLVITTTLCIGLSKGAFSKYSFRSNTGGKLSNQLEVTNLTALLYTVSFHKGRWGSFNDLCTLNLPNFAKVSSKSII